MIYATVGMAIVIILVIATFVWGFQHPPPDRMGRLPNPADDFERPRDDDELPGV